MFFADVRLMTASFWLIDRVAFEPKEDHHKGQFAKGIFGAHFSGHPLLNQALRGFAMGVFYVEARKGCW